MAFPCVIKPVNGYGLPWSVRRELHRGRSRALSIDRGPVHVRLPDGRGIQRRARIQHHDLDRGRRSRIISIADREKIAFEDGEIPQVVRCAYPSPLTAELQEEAASIATKIAGYVGLENGPLCVQAFYREGEGLAVCEAAGRIFGYEHELVTLGSGLSVEELLIDCVYDQPAAKARVLAHSPLFATHAAGLYFHGHDGDVS